MRVAYHRSVFVGFALLTSFPAKTQTWRQVALPGGDVQSLAAASGNAHTLLQGTSDGHVFGSHDGGKMWGHLDSPNAEGTLAALRSGEAGNQLIAASSTEGLFVLEMGSASSVSAD
jgi:hypothetical protein